LLHLPQNPVPHLDLDPQFINPDNNSPQPWLDPAPGEDFFDPRTPHSPFYYTPPDNIERMPNDIHGRMPSPKIEPFKKDEKSNPIRDFKGWYFEKLADIVE
jgi:hypothetical protein